MKELTLRGVFCFKVHGGPHMMAGLPDIIACVEGRFIGLETKLPDGGDASAIQLLIHEMIRDADGEAYVIRSVAEALRVCGLDQ